MHAGFAAGCEAGLRPAVSILNWLGLCPWFGLGPQPSGKARTRGTAQSGNQLTAGQSPASHPAAKPQQLVLKSRSCKLAPTKAVV